MNALPSLVLVLAGLCAPTPAAAHPAAEMCQGERATLVGRPTGVIEGTQRRDVVVTNGAWYTRTYGGDDLVCVTRGSGYNEVDTRGGDDTVIVLAATGRVAMFAGTGADVFRGGPEKDTFLSNDGGDDVRTARNADEVELDTSGAPSTVDLGGGRDTLTVFDDVSDGAGGTVDAGDGQDELSLQVRTKKGAVLIDNVNGSLAVDGATTSLHWSSVESFNLGGTKAGDLTFLGSAVSERLRLDGLQTAQHYDLHLGDGDDDVRAPSGTEGAVDGGPGRDTFRSDPDIDDPTGLVADLALGTVVATYADRQRTWTVGDIEDVEARARFVDGYPVVDLHGDSGPNRLVAKGCDVTIDGGAGDDLLLARGSSCDMPHRRSRATLSGGEGDDRMVGSAGRDTLDGGGGTDTADGGRRRDTCYAETTTRCELP